MADIHKLGKVDASVMSIYNVVLLTHSIRYNLPFDSRSRIFFLLSMSLGHLVTA